MSDIDNNITESKHRARLRAGTLPRISKIPAVALLLLTVFCSVYLSVYRNEIYAAAIILLISLFLVFAVRSFKVIIIIAVPCVSISVFTGSFISVAISLAAITIIGLGAFIINMIRRRYLIAFVPFIYMFSLLITRDFRLALLSLICIPGAVMLAICIFGGKPRISTVVKISAMLATTSLACFLLWAFIKYSSLSLSTFESIININYERLTAYLAQLSLSSMEETVYVFENETAASLAALVINVIPAIFIICCNLTAFFAHLLFMSLYKINNLMPLISGEARKFELSSVSAFIFIVAYVFILLFSNDMKTLFFAVIAENFYLILLFPFAYVGTIAIVGKIMTIQRKRKSLMLLFAMFAVLFMSVAVIIAAYVGVFYTILANRKMRNISKQK